jgi:Methyltransferase domain
MPSVEENRQYWGDLYDWPDHGDEWSATWGGTETQWHATLLPRVRHFLPTGTTLEIAPGYGRWSEYLIRASERYIGVDLAESCVRSCQERFRDVENAAFYVNDGRSLDCVEDSSIDFAFSFDSLVHVEADAIGSYLQELDRTFTPEGVGFLHHSNLGEHATARKRSEGIRKATEKIPLARKALKRWSIIEWDNARAPSMSAATFVGLCDAAGLRCVGQEIIAWDRRSRRVIDCISIVTRPGSQWDRPNVVVRNPNFVSEARSARALDEVFTSLQPRAGAEATPRDVLDR